MADCIFCKDLPKVLENDLTYALFDIKPVSQGHLLVIPKRHFESIFQCTHEEIVAVYDLLHKGKELLSLKFHPDAFNIVVNAGAVAGQVVMHAHVHLIPRYKGKKLDHPNLDDHVIPD